ncbi:hypothetical protein [Spirosoma sp. 209]|uniref:hypothetical protein n=1 Tax=Spirosoma sp. 209 TaxID=1955701 RepID=UPI0013747380|nr:hypothetical protein [Spirosoma sp. 209]
MPNAPLIRGIQYLCRFVLPARLLLAQLPLHLVNVPLQLADALSLAFLHETPDKEKQEENHKSDYHLAHSFLSNERI